MGLLNDPNFWLAFLTVVAIIVGMTAAMLVLRSITLKILHWLEAKFIALAPALLGRRIVGVIRFYYVAALFCGLTAFALSFVIWREPWPDAGLYDPILWNPLFWLTWLAVMAAIMLTGIVGGVLARYALTLGIAKLRGKLARKAR
jgi:hypothetical protein